MEILVLLLLFLLGLFGGSQTVSEPLPLPNADETFQSFAVIETVEGLILESFPPQYQLVVTGYHPVGCEFPTEITQRQDGSDLYIEIYRRVPTAVMCPAVIHPFTETIPLAGDFSQPVTIHVNDFTVETPIGGS